jgi:hypothetical protein
MPDDFPPCPICGMPHQQYGAMQCIDALKIRIDQLIKQRDAWKNKCDEVMGQRDQLHDQLTRQIALKMSIGASYDSLATRYNIERHRWSAIENAMVNIALSFGNAYGSDSETISAKDLSESTLKTLGIDYFRR